MSENVGQGTPDTQQQPEDLPSPNTKLHGDPPAGSPLPGTENPDSDTVKGETNPNTE
jgi:hypothetical protein